MSTFKLRRTLDYLASKGGRGTELISLYVPPDRQIHEVMGNLREEAGTAVNIKSRTTRKNVLEAIEKTMQRLKLFKRPPPNGLVIFCGAIPQDGPGTERIETYVLEPPEPIRTYLYRCDNKFHVELLYEILREKSTFGIVLVDTSEAIIATIRGQRANVEKWLTSGIAGKHRAGGQSARRFERIREAAVDEYYKRIGGYANKIFMEIPDLKGIIMGGPGPSKYDFRDGDYLHYELKKKIASTVDTTYVSENGIDDVMDKTPEILRGVRYLEERQLVQKFLYEVGHDTGLAAYGERDIRDYLDKDLVDTLLLSEKLDRTHVTLRCTNCAFTEDRLLFPDEAAQLEHDPSAVVCKKCNNPTIQIEKKDLLDELVEIAENHQTNVEIISAVTEEGQQLLKGFGGMAAILKYSRRTTD
ncbi:MAG: peptide chain release factor aRF-1 [archaeon]